MSEIVLAPLTIDDLTHLVADALRCDYARAGLVSIGT